MICKGTYSKGNFDGFWYFEENYEKMKKVIDTVEKSYD
jgi:hypothetical protein